MAAPVNACYSAVSCNRTPNSLIWPDCSHLYFGTSNSVAVYNVSKNRIVATCHSQNGRINAVCGIQEDGLGGSCEELVSVSSDNSAAVWRISSSGQALNMVQKLDGHLSSVNVCSGATINSADGRRSTIVTASSDSTMKFWLRQNVNDEFQCKQTLNFETGFVLDTSLIRVPNTNDLLLACGCDDTKIHLFTEQNDQFVRSHLLVGHEDWIRGVEFTLDNNGDMLLASCSQDYYIRVWRLASHDPLRHSEESATDGELKVKERTFSYTSSAGQSICHAVTLETVLAGHDGWVYAVHWQPTIYKDGRRHQPMRLLSASMDKTMIIWAPEAETGVWVEKIRVGTVGGNTLGLYGCRFSPDGASIIAHGYQGALHLWCQSGDTETESWCPSVTVGGHFDDVTDLAWDPVHGDYLLTVGVDQSTRLHGEWKPKAKESSWHELARPQVHGYDLQCITMLDKFRFASGADEKVIRIFTAPRNFVDNFCRMCDQNVNSILTGLSLEDLPEGASVPSLGLSNKAVYDRGDAGLNDVTTDDKDGGPVDYDQSMKPSEGYFQAAKLEEPPSEEDLLQNTLWPETSKLYGHGYEIFSLASSPDGKQLASACKAAKPEHAAILVWDTMTWKQMQCLSSHSLTVTQLQFSPCSAYLLSVSRDRTWTLFKRKDEHDLTMIRVGGTGKKNSVHTRIIWSCAWSRDSKYYVTVSRDKKAIMWRPSPDVQTPIGCVLQTPHILELSQSITAVDIAPVSVNESYLVSLGLENGCIELHFFSEDQGWRRLHTLNTSQAHHGTVKRLRFRPRPVTSHSGQNYVIHLASCGVDNAVKIHEINIR